MNKIETTSGLPRAILAILILFPFAYAVLSLAMGQDANWDLRNYHWYNGYALLHGRFTIDLLPSQTPFFYNPLLDSVWYAFASTVPAWFASFTLSAIQGLNFILLFALARRTIDPLLPRRDLYALLIAALGMIGGGWLAELGTVFYDNILSLGIFGSALLVLKADKALGFRQLKFWPVWILAGIPVGLATGIKLPTATFCVGLCVAIFVIRAPATERFARAFAFGLGVLIGIAATLGYWSWHLWTMYQNPLFPYFNNVFHSPITLPTSARDEQFLPRGWLRLIFPYQWTLDPLKVGEVPFRDLKLPILYTLVPLILLVRLILPRRKHAARYQSLTTPDADYVLAMLGISYLAWLLMFGIYRYGVPLEALSALGLFLALDKLPLAPRAKQIGYLAIAVIVLATLQVANWTRTSFSHKFVEVTRPDIADPQNTMILMAGFQPYSHVLPAFPSEIPFVRIQSNFASPEEPKQIIQIMKDKVAAWPGQLMVLLPLYDVPWVSRDVLPQFGLKTDLSSCQPVQPNFTETFSLCSLQRTK